MFARATSSNVTVSPSTTNVASIGLKVRTGIRGGLKAGMAGPRPVTTPENCGGQGVHGMAGG